MIAFANPPVRKNPYRTTLRKHKGEMWKGIARFLLWITIAGIAFFCIMSLPPTPTNDTILAFIGGGCCSIVFFWDICGGGK